MKPRKNVCPWQLPVRTILASMRPRHEAAEKSHPCSQNTKGFPESRRNTNQAVANHRLMRQLALPVMRATRRVVCNAGEKIIEFHGS